MNQRPELYIGIDPDVQASGFAVWHEKQFKELSCLHLAELFTTLECFHAEYRIMVRLEAGWLAKGYNWHKGGLKSANDVGRNHEIGRQIEKHCKQRHIPYILVKPLGYSSYTHERFCMFTKWPVKNRTNSETRVAGMLVYGF
jgi:hypothetical protein